MADIDLESVVIAVLGDAGLVAVGDLEPDQTRPVIAVAGNGGRPASSQAPDWLVAGDLQLDCYGTTRVEALDTAVAARKALLAAPRLGTPAAGGLLQSVTVTAPSWVPDEDWPDEGGRPGPRYLIQIAATAHPEQEA